MGEGLCAKGFFHMLSFDPSSSFEKLVLICMFRLSLERQAFLLTTLLRGQHTSSCELATSMLKVKNVGRDDLWESMDFGV